MKTQIHAFILAMLIPLAVSAESSESQRIKGVADFLVDRAAENALYIYEGRVKDNKFFRTLFPETCKLLKNGSLRQLLYSDGVWENTVRSDIRTTFKVVAVMYTMDKFLYLDFLDKTENKTSISDVSKPDTMIQHVLKGYFIYEDLDGYDNDEVSDIKTYLYFGKTLHESYRRINRLTAGVDDEYDKLRQYLIDSEYEDQNSGLEGCSSIVNIYDMTDKIELVRDEISIIVNDIKKSIRGLSALVNILREHMDNADHKNHISDENFKKVTNILVRKKKVLQDFVDEVTTIQALTSDSIYDEFMIRANLLSDDIYKQALRDTYKTEVFWYRQKEKKVDKKKIQRYMDEENNNLKNIAKQLELMSELGEITGDSSGVLVKEKIDQARDLSGLIVKIKSKNVRNKVKVLVSNIKKKIKDDGRNVFEYAVLAEKYISSFINKNEKYKRECELTDLYFSEVEVVDPSSTEYYEKYGQNLFTKDGEKYLESYQKEDVCVKSYARGTYARFKKTMFLFAQLADAKTGEELKELLEIATVPAVSFGIKRTPGETHFMISSYLGYSFALNDDDLVDEDTRHSLSVPMGIEWSRGCSRGGARWYDPASYCREGSLNFLLAPFDLAVPVNLLFEDSDAEVELKDIISPGAYLSYGFKSLPVVLGVGYSKGRALNGINNEKEERFMLFLSFDMPLFTLY